MAAIEFASDLGIATLTINRPEAMNALNSAALDELDALVARIGADDAIRVVVITGSGQRAFSAGADLAELAQKTPVEMLRLSERAQELLRRIENLGKPVIAAINGLALGAGFELSLAASVRMMAEGARVGFPEIGLGAIPGYGGTQRLTRLVGAGLGLEMLLTGAQITAQRAYEIGLTGRVVAAEALQAEARKLAERLAALSPLAMRLLLQVVQRGAESGPDAGFALERFAVATLFASDDLREGISAFAAKRRPVFQGR